MDKLEEARKRINAIDSRIAGLLEERFMAVCDVASYKSDNNMPVLDVSREKKVIERVSDSLLYDEYRGYICKIYEEIMKNSRLMQKLKIGNIYLIGMPGCGKTTVGRKLAMCLQRSFVDADVFFETTRGISAGLTIEQQGEDEFRKQETEILGQLAASKHTVIALGGGAVTRKENRDIIGDDSLIIYIERDLDKLETNGRPLSKSVGVEKLFSERKALYESWADITVHNDGTDAVVDEILIELGIE